MNENFDVLTDEAPICCRLGKVILVRKCGFLDARRIGLEVQSMVLS